MDDTMQVVGHMGFTWTAYVMSHWTEIGAGVLMAFQFILLILKLYDGYKKEIQGEY